MVAVPHGGNPSPILWIDGSLFRKMGAARNAKRLAQRAETLFPLRRRRCFQRRGKARAVIARGIRVWWCRSQGSVPRRDVCNVRQYRTNHRRPPIFMPFSPVEHNL